MKALPFTFRMFSSKCSYCVEKIKGAAYEAYGAKFCSRDHAELYKTRKQLGLNPSKTERPLKLPFRPVGEGCAC